MNKLGKKKILSMLMFAFLAGLAVVSVPAPPVQASPAVTFTVDMPNGYIPGKPVGSLFWVNILIDASNLEWQSLEGIIQWAMDVCVDPDVLEPIGVRGAQAGYFLYDFVDFKCLYEGICGYKVRMPAPIIDGGCFIDISEYITPPPPWGAGHKNDPYGISNYLVSLRFKSKSETAYSKIDIINPMYRDATGVWHNVEDVDGHYNTIPGDIMGDTPGSPPDGDVDKYDLGAFAEAYGSHPGDPNWNPKADLDDDGDVDKYDLGIFAENYGKSL